MTFRPTSWDELKTLLHASEDELQSLLAPLLESGDMYAPILRHCISHSKCFQDMGASRDWCTYDSVNINILYAGSCAIASLTLLCIVRY